LFKFRVRILMGLLVAGFLVLLGRLAQLQLFRGTQYRQLAVSTALKEKSLADLRGEIRDRFGRLLACDRPSFDLAVRVKELSLTTIQLADVKKARDESTTPDARKAAFSRLAFRLQFDPWVLHLSKDVRRKPEELADGLVDALDQVGRKWASPREPVTFLRDIDEPVWTALRAQVEERLAIPPSAPGMAAAPVNPADLPGLACTHSVRRAYPNGTLLAHVLGTLGELTPAQVQQLREAGELIDRLEDRTRFWIRFQAGLDEKRAQQIAEVIGTDPRTIDDVASLMECLDSLTPAQRQAAVRLGLADVVRWSERPLRMELCEAERIWLGCGLLDNPRPKASLPDRRVGESGVECWYNQMLRGKHGLDFGVNGQAWLTANPAWREAARPRRGDALVLSISMEWQAACEEALRSCGKPAAGVVLDCRTGEVLALASYPTFDPNLFSPPREGEWRQQQLAALLKDTAKPLLNRAIAERYPLGSVMKVLIAAAALELNVASPTESNYCSGYLQEGRVRYHCDAHRAHGQVELVEALRRSCNVYFYRLGARAGVESIAPFASAVGLGRRTGLDLTGEVTGVFPDRTWRVSHFGARSPEVAWSRGKDYHMAIGQGYVSVTPLQAASLLACIANGGYPVRPHLWKQAPTDPPASRLFSERAVSIVRQGLDEVCNVGTPGARGTAYSAFHTGEELAVRVAGKTGTADVAGDKPPHAWFAGYAPSGRPEVAFCFFIEHGGHGGEAAAPLAYRALKKVYGTRNAPRPQQGTTTGVGDSRPAPVRADLVELPMVTAR
jgi:cell division protein FtsI/penicillin-binding protein 2